MDGNTRMMTPTATRDQKAVWQCASSNRQTSVISRRGIMRILLFSFLHCHSYLHSYLFFILVERQVPTSIPLRSFAWVGFQKKITRHREKNKLKKNQIIKQNQITQTSQDVA
jgi:hypothetical protein